MRTSADRRSAPSIGRGDCNQPLAEGRNETDQTSGAKKRAARTKDAALKTKNPRSRNSKSRNSKGKNPGEETAKQREWQTKHQAEDTAMMRALCKMLKFWRACAQKLCRRTHACSGDPHACFARWWPPIPEDEKVWFRAMIKARVAGLGPREIVKAADAEVARYADLLARHIERRAQYEQPQTGAKSAPIAAADVAQHGREPRPERTVARVRLV